MEKNKIIMDTSAYSSHLRGNPEIKLSIQQADEIFLNPVILGELLAGFIMGKSEKKNRLILEEFLSSPRVKVVAIDEETSERYAVIMNHLRKEGTPIPTNDLWIAAVCLQNDLPLLTLDKHFTRIPQLISLKPPS